MSTYAVNGSLAHSHPSPPFDAIAQDYDRIFTHSILGRAQRSLIHEALRGHFREGQRILDLNCGTGEDAIHLASQGLSVLACDISGRMIDVARSKAALYRPRPAIDFAVCANENLDLLHGEVPFDGVLSNFGGLNCTADLAAVALSLSRLVRPGGKVFLCMLGHFSGWEVFWYSTRAQWSKAFRRIKTGGTEARIGGEGLRVYYPGVRDLRDAFAPAFRLVSWCGIGVVLPPSWMEAYFQHRRGLVNFLARVDRILGPIPVFRGAADHILYQFVREGK
jgi:ubiquinone/menaquinone biosynthesis C-methylase UbiE